MSEISVGCMAIVVGLDYPFLVIAHVNAKTFDGLWDCTIVSKIHNYVDVYLAEEFLSRITDSDELVIELYAKAID